MSNKRLKRAEKTINAVSQNAEVTKQTIDKKTNEPKKIFINEQGKPVDENGKPLRLSKKEKAEVDRQLQEAARNQNSLRINPSQILADFTLLSKKYIALKDGTLAYLSALVEKKQMITKDDILKVILEINKMQ